MPFDILALIGVGVAIGVAAGISLEQYFSQKRRKAWWASKRSPWPNRSKSGIAAGPWSAKRSRPDAADQLRIVLGATFTVQPLLNKPEARLFKELDRIVIGCNPGWQVMAQVSLGEILRSKDAEAYSCINSKRVDFLLVDDECQPHHAIEYQGGGHHQGSAAARDAVKKEALRRAGIGYHEIIAGQTRPSDLRQLVEKLVDKSKATTVPAATAQTVNTRGFDSLRPA